MEQPIEARKGSKMPGDLSEKIWHKLGFRFYEDYQLKMPFRWIDPRAFLESRLPLKLAVPPKRLIALPGQKPHGRIVCTRDAYGLAELHLEIEDEQINLCETLQNWTYIDTSLAAHGGSTVSAVASGAVSLVTDNIPVWAEVSAVAAIVATIPRRRVRLLLEFKTNRQPMVIETADVIAVLLDHICGGGSDEDEERTGTAAEGTGEIYVMF